MSSLLYQGCWDRQWGAQHASLVSGGDVWCHRRLRSLLCCPLLPWFPTSVHPTAAVCWVCGRYMSSLLPLNQRLAQWLPVPAVSWGCPFGPLPIMSGAQCSSSPSSFVSLMSHQPRCCLRTWHCPGMADQHLVPTWVLGSVSGFPPFLWQSSSSNAFLPHSQLCTK